MTRPRKQTVDYFPHDCNHGKTMFIIEQRYGNDGYAFWFKLLELLGKTQGHYLDLAEISNLEFLASVTRISSDLCIEIVNLLARLEAIDSDLWQSKIVWSDNFVSRISDVYRNRVLETPIRPDFLRKKHNILRQSDSGNPQTKLNESKVNNPPLPPKGDSNGFDEFWKTYPKKIGKGAAFKKWEGLKRIHRLPSLETIIAAVERQKTWEQWQRDEGQYIPNPATWLNQGRWDDQPPEGGKPEWMKGLSES